MKVKRTRRRNVLSELYNSELEKRKRFVKFFYASLLFMGLFDIFIFVIDPSRPIMLFTIQASPLIPFFLFLLCFIFTFFTYLLSSIRRGIFASVFVFLILALRTLQYRSILYTIILLLIFFVMEFLVFQYFKKPKKTSSELHLKKL